MKEFQIKTKKYKVNDIHLNVAEVGKGKPIIFIHGWANSWIGWTLLAKELYKDYKLYMIDVPGFGDSDSLPTYSLEIINNYISEFIKIYAPNTVAVVGASAGTFLTVHLAVLSNFNFHLILIGTVLHRRKTKIIKEIYSRFLSLSANSPIAHEAFEQVIKNKYSAYLVEKYLNAYKFNKRLVDLYFVPGRKRVTGKSYIQLGVSMMGYVMDEELKTIKNQTLLIFGSHDKYVPTNTAKNFINKISKKNLYLEIINNAGHSPAYEQPKETARIIKEFLSSMVD